MPPQILHRRTATTGGRILAVPPIDLTDLELETAARACRALAYQQETGGQADGESRNARAGRKHGGVRRGAGGEVRGSAQETVNSRARMANNVLILGAGAADRRQCRLYIQRKIPIWALPVRRRRWMMAIPRKTSQRK
jgi:hypothetical protein